jgi:hypothetical protein
MYISEYSELLFVLVSTVRVWLVTRVTDRVLLLLFGSLLNCAECFSIAVCGYEHTDWAVCGYEHTDWTVCGYEHTDWTETEQFQAVVIFLDNACCG